MKNSDNVKSQTKSNDKSSYSRNIALFDFLRKEVFKKLGTGAKFEEYQEELEKLLESDEATNIINYTNSFKKTPLTEPEVKAIVKSIAKYYSMQKEVVRKDTEKPKYDGSFYQQANEKKKKEKLNRLENIKRIVKDLKNPTQEEIRLVAELFNIEETLVRKDIKLLIKEKNKSEKERILELADKGYKIREIKEMLNLEKSIEAIMLVVNRARKKKKSS